MSKIEFLKNDRNISRLLIQLFLLSLLVNFASLETINYQEQWNKIDLGKYNTWNTKGDAVVNSDGFTFERTSGNTATEIGGSAWSPISINNKNGIKMSFAPVIGMDESFYGNLKYPQGFAIVFTSSDVTNRQGRMGSGLGYDGIKVGVAFEFDFVQQKDQNDLLLPHFSAHGNLEKEISSKSETNKPYQNIKLPNFYDETKEGFEENVRIYIEVFGGKLKVYKSKSLNENTQSDILIQEVDFNFLDQLMENEKVYVGITASMNLQKSVQINDFELFEIALAEMGKISFQKQQDESIVVGSSIEFNYQLLSVNGKPLVIHKKQFDEIILNVNGKAQNINDKTFDVANKQLKLSLKDIIKVGTYSVIVEWKGHSTSNVLKFSTTAGAILRYDFCDKSIEYNNNYFTPSLVEQHFVVYLCSFDQYNNPKEDKEDLFKNLGVYYPNNFEPNKQPFPEAVEGFVGRYMIEVPLFGYGEYSLFHPYFQNENIRIFDFKPTTIVYEKSYGEIIGGIIDVLKGEKVLLRINIMNYLGEIFTKKQLQDKDLKCVFEQSTINGNIILPSSDEILEKRYGYPVFEYTANNEEQYNFVPSIKCNNDEKLLNCPSCKFEVKKTTQTIGQSFLIYSDYENKTYISDDITQENPLLISLDEAENIKITEVTFLDQGKMAITNEDAYPKTLTITGQLDSSNLLFPKLPNGFSIEMKSKRSTIRPYKKMTLKVEINIDGKAFTKDIFMRFVYKNNWLNNYSPQSIGSSPKYLGFYQPSSSVIEATDKILLFSVYLSNGDFFSTENFDCTQLKLKLSTEDTAIEGLEKGITLLPPEKSTSNELECKLYFKLTYARTEPIKLAILYGSTEILTHPITVTANREPHKLVPVDKQIGTVTETLITLTPQKVQEIKTYDFKMIDKYSNEITLNGQSSYELLRIERNGLNEIAHMNGLITIIADGHVPGKQSIKFSCRTGSVLTIEMTKTLNLEAVDPTTSSVKITHSDEHNYIVEFVPKDSFYNDLTRDILANQAALSKVVAALDVFAIERDGSVFEFTYTEVASSPHLQFKNKITKRGEYTIKIFYNEMPIETGFSSFVISSIIDYTQTTISMISNKMKIPIFPNDPNKLQIVNKKLPFIFILESKDSDGRDMHNSKSYSLTLKDSKEEKSVKICSLMSTKYETRQLYNICPNSLKSYKELPDGEYRITVDNIIFRIMLTDDVTMFSKDEAAEPSEKSMLMTNQPLIGSNDKPTNFLIDFRTQDNLRFNHNLDLSKIVLSGKDSKGVELFAADSYKFLYHNEKGIVAGFFNVKAIGDLTFDLSYKDKVLIKGIKLTNSSGDLKTLSDPIQKLSFAKGSYVIYQAKDIFGESLKKSIELQSEENLQNLVVLKDALGLYHATKNSYNPNTGKVTVFIPKYHFGSFELESPYIIIDNDSTLQKVVITETIQGSNISVYLQGTVLKVVLYDENHKKIASPTSEHMNVLTPNFSVDVLVKENFNYVYYQRLTLANNKLDISVESIKHSDVIFVPYFQGRQIICSYCRILSSTTQLVEIAKTKMYIKNGQNAWNEKLTTQFYPIFKHQLPIFKVQLFDGFNVKISNPSSISAKIIKGTEVLDYLSIITTKTGDVYMSLNAEGRTKIDVFEGLTNLKIQVKYETEKQIEFENIILLDGLREPVSNTLCFDKVRPVIDYQPEKYYMTAEEELIIDFRMTGCEKDEKALLDISKFELKTTTSKTLTPSQSTSSASEVFYVIPGDSYGHYLLIYQKTKTTNSLEEEKFELKYLDGKPLALAVKILPANNKYKISLEQSDEKYTLDNTHAYFYFTAKDQNDNEITSETISMEYSDFLIQVTDKNNDNVSYKVTYNKNLKKFMGEIPITAMTTYKIANSEGSQEITIGGGVLYPYAHASVLNQQVSIELKDKTGKGFSMNDLDYSKNFEIKYLTINTITKETFVYNLEILSSSGNKITFKEEKQLPKYHISSYLITSKSKVIACSNCYVINKQFNYGYIVQPQQTLLPLSVAFEKTIESKIENMLYFFETDSEINQPISSISSSEVIMKIGSAKAFRIFKVYGYKTKEQVNQSLPSNININYQSTTTDGSLKVRFYSSDLSAPSIKKPLPSNIKVYGRTAQTVYSNQEYSFFMELRDQENQLTTFKTQLNQNNIPDMPYSVMVPTALQGLYLVIIPTTKHFSNSKFTAGITEGIPEGNNQIDLFIQGKADFPKLLDLKSETTINGNTIMFEVDSFDSHGNIVCDNRLNLYATTNDNKSIPYTLHRVSQRECVAYFHFIGYAMIESPLLTPNIRIENYKTIPKSPFISVMFSEYDSVDYKLQFQIYGNNGYSFPAEYSMNDLALNVYKVISDQKKELIQELKGLYSGSYTFKPDQLKIRPGSQYALVPIIDGIEFIEKTLINHANAKNEETKKLQVSIYRNNIYDPLPISKKSSAVMIEEEMVYPFQLKVEMVNNAGDLIEITGKTLTIDIYAKSNVGTADVYREKALFNIVQVDVYHYIATIARNKMDEYLHLPMSQYTIEYKLDAMTFYTLVRRTNTMNRLYNSNFKYQFNIAPFSNKVGTVNANNDFVDNNVAATAYVTNNNKWVKTMICYSDNLKTVFNGYKTLTPSLGDVIITPNGRGCYDLYYKTTTNTDLYIKDLNTNISKYQMFSKAEEVKEANFEVEVPWKETASSGVEGNTLTYKLFGQSGLASFNPSQLEVYINGFFFPNCLINNSQIKINQHSYPPENQFVSIYYRDMQHKIYLKAFEGNVKVSPAVETVKLVLSSQSIYLAGTVATFFIEKLTGTNYCDSSIKVEEFEKYTFTLTGPGFSDKDIEKSLINTSENPRCSAKVQLKTKLILSKVGEYTFKGVKEGSSSDTDKLDLTFNLQPNEVNEEKSSFKIDGTSGTTDTETRKAGEEFLIQFYGKDIEGNNVDYIDLADEISLEFPKLNPGEFAAKAYAEKDHVLIKLTINKAGEYKDFVIRNKKAFVPKENRVKTLIIKAAECSSLTPHTSIPKIDERHLPGDILTMSIICADQFNNVISPQSFDNFNVRIEGRDLDIVSTDSVPFKFQCSNTECIVTFLLAYKGTYSVKTEYKSLDYGEEYTITVENETCKNESEETGVTYMCPNRQCNKDLSQCHSSIDSKCTSQDFSSGITYSCIDKNPKDPENPIICGEIEQCALPDKMEECEGMWFFEKDNFCKAPRKSNCINAAQQQFPNETIADAKDGTCRVDSNSTPSRMGCPIGYLPCGAQCQKYSQNPSADAFICTETSDCKPNEVICWDLSCSSSYDYCPTRKTCKKKDYFVCPDGKCVKKGIECSQPPQCQQGTILCPDFTCKKTKKDCVKNPTCPIGYALCESNICKKNCNAVTICDDSQILCPNGDCKSNSLQCPSSMFCPPEYIKCEIGGCARSQRECAFLQGMSKISCPLQAAILCSDLSCQDKTEKCPPVNECPLSHPYKCWDNECKKSLVECPTQITCPTDFPVLCNNGECKKASYHCPAPAVNDSTQKTCKVRCFDGLCAKRILECPTRIQCAPDKILCWNGSCDNKGKCRPIENKCIEVGFTYTCPDGSCRKSQQDCYSSRVCPLDKPVKCYDLSCRENYSMCPADPGCGSNLVSCPDGTCAKSFNECSGIVTCTMDQYLCADHRCVSSLDQCSKPLECPNQVTCPNGTCASHRQNCQPLPICTPKKPVMCPNLKCSEEAQKCQSNDEECPETYIKCPNGECRINESYCDPFVCPKHLSHFCPEGVCAKDASFCDDNFTGCPYNKPFRCPFGKCVTNSSQCDKKVYKCNQEKGVICLDGSCADSIDECPLINGCPIAKSQKCADGTCVNPPAQCSPVMCNRSNSFKCPDGTCARTQADCFVQFRQKYLDDCEKEGMKGLYMCADGRCVVNLDYCRPLFNVQGSEIKCSDGTLRSAAELCPKEDQCPKTKSYYCSNGKCVQNKANDSEEEETKLQRRCSNDCPEGYYLCTTNGRCVKEKKDDEPQPPKDPESQMIYRLLETANEGEEETCPKDTASIPAENGCPIIKEEDEEGKTKERRQVKCRDGRCLKDQEQCDTIHPSCTEDAPMLCSNGKCGKKEDCDAAQGDCDEGFERCPNGKCVSKGKKDDECLIESGCQGSKPFRCDDGTCKVHYSQCPTVTYCNEINPIPCGDGSCSSNENQCPRFIPCAIPEAKNTKVFECPVNHMCVNKESDCKKYESFCPLSSPIKCPTGRCVKDLKECSLTYLSEKCNKDGIEKLLQFFCHKKAKCVSSAKECFGENSANGKPNGSSRLLAESTAVQNNCPKESPYSCYDGTCANKKEDCPLLPACPIGHYRCQSGVCAEDCTESNKQSVTCASGLKKCEDGLCRATCPDYNGCALNQYQCSNGMCVQNKLECIGFSMCSNHLLPYRCFNGECKGKIEECIEINRLNSPSSFTQIFNTQNNMEVAFAQNRKGKNIGKLTMPSSSITLSSNDMAEMIIKEVAHSTLYSNNNSIMQDYKSKHKVSNGVIGSEGQLNFEQSVLSPVISFKVTNFDSSKELNEPALVYLEYNVYKTPFITYNDYCLAKWEYEQWMCVARPVNADDFTFKITHLGTYAVVLNPPLTEIIAEVDEKNFFLENMKILLITVAVVAVVAAIVFYAFGRIIRYREKYKESQNKIRLLQQQREEYEQMYTDVFGQTLGDNLIGMIYTKNCIFAADDEKKELQENMEMEVENLKTKCIMLDGQNKKIQESIDTMNEKYKALAQEINDLKKKDL